ncbi:synaptonemal complex central element protein 2 [Xyrichtys novacula]|uniref:Synaptonemal complex central element protein 2 n=1 Tax=Xyrichtys novacula TaxID=13765 RepID=A0AAV1EYY0_XYRNO|nr:synaptonemal complex central element protein 2 [Xyrichtys novacula]
MDFSSGNLPCLPESSPTAGLVDSQMTGDSHDSLRTNASSLGIAEVQEQHTSLVIDSIRGRVQDLVQKINDRRTSDQKEVDDFEEQLVTRVREMTQQMKEGLYTVYEENTSVMQTKLQELSEVLDNCTKLNEELMEANQALSRLREGLPIYQTPE